MKQIGTTTGLNCTYRSNECSGNSLHSCVLDALGDDQDKKVEFVVCQMRENADLTGQNVSGAFQSFHLYFH